MSKLSNSRRLFGKRLLVAVPAAAASLLSLEAPQAQAAAPTAQWLLGGNEDVARDGSNFIGTKYNAPLVFKTNAALLGTTERMRITESGNVGIGIINPSARLAVVTDTGGGILGKHTATTGTEPGVEGQTASSDFSAAGVTGKATASSGTTYGVYGTAFSPSGYGVFGHSMSGMGVYGSSSSRVGVYGTSTSGTAVYGSSGSNAGVYGTSSTSYGVYGTSSSGIGVYGFSTSNYAGYFYGKVHVNGAFSVAGGAKNFVIDHPLDPENKYLYHAAIEAPEMKNIYDGTATLDDRGEATVELPAYFEALNKDFRYQLTAIGAPAPNLYIADEIKQSRFRIAGGSAGMKVSWQVTGVRNDAWAAQNPLAVEVDKPADERGTYLTPKAHGQPESKGVGRAKIEKQAIAAGDARP